MSSRIVLITGANTGLGYQIVRAFCQSQKGPYHVLLGGRSIAKAEQAAKDAAGEFPSSKTTIQPVQIDIEDDNSIERLYKDVESKYGRLDTLINNAGAQFDPVYRDGQGPTRELWDRSWSVNVTSTQVMTETFVPLLLKSEDPRLLFMASGTSSMTIAENHDLPINLFPAKGWPKRGQIHASNIPAYRSSKAGMNMMMLEWDRLLRNDGVKVWSISPGALATGLGIGVDANKAAGTRDPAPAGEFIRDVVEGIKDSETGKVVMVDRIQPW